MSKKKNLYDKVTNEDQISSLIKVLSGTAFDDYDTDDSEQDEEQDDDANFESVLFGNIENLYDSSVKVEKRYEPVETKHEAIINDSQLTPVTPVVTNEVKYTAAVQTQNKKTDENSVKMKPASTAKFIASEKQEEEEINIDKFQIIHIENDLCSLVIHKPWDIYTAHTIVTFNFKHDKYDYECEEYSDLVELCKFAVAMISGPVAVIRENDYAFNNFTNRIEQLDTDKVKFLSVVYDDEGKKSEAILVYLLDSVSLQIIENSFNAFEQEHIALDFCYTLLRSATDRCVNPFATRQCMSSIIDACITEDVDNKRVYEAIRNDEDTIIDDTGNVDEKNLERDFIYPYNDIIDTMRRYCNNLSLLLDTDGGETEDTAIDIPKGFISEGFDNTTDSDENNDPVEEVSNGITLSGGEGNDKNEDEVVDFDPLELANSMMQDKSSDSSSMMTTSL